MVQQVVDAVPHVRDALRTSEVAKIRPLHVDSDGERVVLRGTVGSYYSKRLAQELVHRVVNGLQIENTIYVEYDACYDQPDSRVIERY